MKQYPVLCPPLEPLKPCINPMLNPCLGMLDYCALIGRVENMTFGGEGLAFTGNCCGYHQVMCCANLKSCCTCSIYSCCGGDLLAPTYLDQHTCLTKEKDTHLPGNRWEDAGKCKERFKEIKTQAKEPTGPPFDEHMYLMQPVPSPPCCESMKNCCSSYGDKEMMFINNRLRYIRIGHKQMRFTGDAAGFNALRPSCCFCCHHCPCYTLHKTLGTYTKAYNQYIDNHLEWLPEGHAPPGVARDMAAGKMSAKVHPDPAADAPGQQSADAK
jgi:hypothetical protein